MRAFYFFAFGGLGAVFPFLPLLLRGKSLAPRQISWVMTLFPASNLAVPPLWGIAADLFGRRLPLLRAAAATTALATLLLWPASSLWSLSVAVLLYCIGRAPISSLADAITAAQLGNARERFARIRVFGSIGFALAVLVVGQLAVASRPALFVSIAGALYLIAALSTLRVGEAAPEAAQIATRERVRFADVLQRLRDPFLLLLLAGNATYYAAHAAYDAFFSLHLGQLGFSDGFIGVAWMVGVLVEILLLIVAPPLMVHSRRLLAACGVMATTRWLLLSMLSSRATIAAIAQPMHGVTFGIWYIAMVKEVQDRAPERLRAAQQSLAAAATGFGMVVGYLGGGALFASGAGPLVFRVASGAAALATVIYLVYLRRASRCAT
ncbi:MAG: MFS transporter [Myxococcales bacterium]|nr:MFS transporter [Myxococcales bacterium]